VVDHNARRRVGLVDGAIGAIHALNDGDANPVVELAGDVLESPRAGARVRVGRPSSTLIAPPT
jgi:hypothetical protein